MIATVDTPCSVDMQMTMDIYIFRVHITNTHRNLISVAFPPITTNNNANLSKMPQLNNNHTLSAIVHTYIAHALVEFSIQFEWFEHRSMGSLKFNGNILENFQSIVDYLFFSNNLFFTQFTAFIHCFHILNYHRRLLNFIY